MPENILNNQIVEFLKEDKPSFNEGLRLYAAHPNHRKNIVIASENRYRHGSTHLKIIYELENLVYAEEIKNKSFVHSEKATVLKESPLNIPFQIVKNTEKVAPSNFKYETKLEDLPAELKALVIEKGELYNKNNILKNELAKSGQKNDEAAILLRQQKRAEMHQNYETIVSHHNVLINYDKTKIVELAPVEDKIIENTELSLEEEYKYETMSWAERKLLRKSVQSNLGKQLERAKTSKTEKTKETNAIKAIRTKAMLDILDAYFAENKEAPE